MRLDRFGRWNLAIEAAGFMPIDPGRLRRNGIDGVYWTRERQLAAIQAFVDRHGRLPVSADFAAAMPERAPAARREHGDPTGSFRSLPSFNAITDTFGSVEAALAAAGFQYDRHVLGYWTKPRIVEALTMLAHKLGRQPVETDLHALRSHGRHDLPGASSVREAFGSFGAALVAAGFTPSVVRSRAANGVAYWTPDRVLDTIRYWVQTHGEPPSQRQWTKAGAIVVGDRQMPTPTASTVSRIFGTWGAALDRAGYPAIPVRRSRIASQLRAPRWTHERIIDALVRWHHEHGCLPSSKDWARADPGGAHPASATVIRIVGAFRTATELASDTIGDRTLRPRD